MDNSSMPERVAAPLPNQETSRSFVATSVLNKADAVLGLARQGKDELFSRIRSQKVGLTGMSLGLALMIAACGRDVSVPSYTPSRTAQTPEIGEIRTSPSLESAPFTTPSEFIPQAPTPEATPVPPPPLSSPTPRTERPFTAEEQKVRTELENLLKSSFGQGIMKDGVSLGENGVTHEGLVTKAHILMGPKRDNPGKLEADGMSSLTYYEDTGKEYKEYVVFIGSGGDNSYTTTVVRREHGAGFRGKGKGPDQP